MRIKDLLRSFKTIKIHRPARRGDMWTYFKRQPNGSRILRVENKPHTVVYFLNWQRVEVHRRVVRDSKEWIEIEEATFFCSNGDSSDQGFFHFLYYGEQVKLCNLPDDTRFIPLDPFKCRGGGKKKRKKKSLSLPEWLMPSLPHFQDPQPVSVPV
jgi:hypothetical protein